MFDFENDSEADAKTATSLVPAATAASKPWKKQMKQFRGSPSKYDTIIGTHVVCPDYPLLN
jgi:hypothetical protein